jgi:hypothetical protein
LPRNFAKATTSTSGLDPQRIAKIHHSPVEVKGLRSAAGDIGATFIGEIIFVERVV